MEIIKKEEKTQNQTVKEVSLEQEFQTLRFNKLQPPAAQFTQIDSQPILVNQKQKHAKFILIQSHNEHKIYQVREKKIHFVSQHKIQFPFNLPKIHKTVISENWIRHFIELSKVFNSEEDPKWVKLIKEYEIDTDEQDFEYLTTLVFESKFGPEQPETIIPTFVGKIRRKDCNLALTSFLGIFDDQKPLIGTNSCLVQQPVEYDVFGNRRGDQRPPDQFFLAKFSKKFENLHKKLLKLNLDFEETESYKTKIEQDKQLVCQNLYQNPQFSFYFGYQKKSLLHFENNEPGVSKKLRSFVKIDQKMLIIGVIDFRTRKLVARRFISIYEFFENLA